MLIELADEAKDEATAVEAAGDKQNKRCFRPIGCLP